MNAWLGYFAPVGVIYPKTIMLKWVQIPIASKSKSAKETPNAPNVTQLASPNPSVSNRPDEGEEWEMI
jgi:hypothetical protein